jgi:hypothetical protein
MPDVNLTQLTKKNLLYALEAAIGSELFKHIYVRHADGHEFDALDGGDLSCAYFVSGILALMSLIDRPHATVETTLQCLQEAGWQQSEKPVPGSVVLWPKDNTEHAHIGFYVDDATCVSNSSVDRRPAKHGRTLQDGREPSAYYVHATLLGPVPL